MRRRITRTLFAAAAAGVTVSTLGFAAAGSASAAVSSKAQPPTIGTTIGSTSSAGYEASGRDFRYITSTIRVPDTDFLTGLSPQEYIQLSNGSLTHPTGGGGNQGDGVNFSIYYNELGNELSYVISPPSTSGTPQFYKTQAYGAIFDHAPALEHCTDSTGAPMQ